MAVAIALLAAGLGVIGAACMAWLPRQHSRNPGDSLLPGFDAVLSGLAAASWITMILALARCLSGATAAIAAVAFVGATSWRRRASGPPPTT